MNDDGISDAAAERQLLADRVHRFRTPRRVLYARLVAPDSAWWLGLHPGEVEPRVLEAIASVRVVWSSMWPVSPDDTIELDLSADDPTNIRLRWYSRTPPDARGIGITRQRLNRKLGGNLRGAIAYPRLE